MKKIIFSAIAVVAFVGSSMAGGNINPNIRIIKNSNDETPPVAELNECFFAAMFMMDRIEYEYGEINDINEFNATYQYYVTMCEAGRLKL